MFVMQTRWTRRNLWSMKSNKSFRWCFLSCKIYSVFHQWCCCIKASKVEWMPLCVLTETLSWRSAYIFDLCLCPLFKARRQATWQKKYLFLKFSKILTYNSRLVCSHVELLLMNAMNCKYLLTEINSPQDPFVFALSIEFVSFKYTTVILWQLG